MKHLSIFSLCLVMPLFTQCSEDKKNAEMIQNKENAEIIQNYVTTAMSNTTKVALEIIDKEYENKIALDNNQTKNVKEFVYTLGNVVKEFSENTFKIQKQIILQLA